MKPRLKKNSENIENIENIENVEKLVRFVHQEAKVISKTILDSSNAEDYLNKVLKSSYMTN